LFPLAFLFFQKQPEKVLRAYPTQPQPEQQTQSVNTNKDYGLKLSANPDIVQSIEIHSFDVPVIAARSQQDNGVDETILHNGTITNNVTDNMLISTDGSDVNRLKRDTSLEKVINPPDPHKHKLTHILQKVKAYNLSTLSNGYETKMNFSTPPPETRPSGTKRVRRSAAALVSQYEELMDIYPEEIQARDNGGQNNLPEIQDHHRRHERTAMKLIPVDRKDTQTYQVYEMSDEEPNQESNVRSNPSINKNTSPVHKTMTSHNRQDQQERRPLPGKASTDLSSKHNENSEGAITVTGHTSALVDDEYNYGELDEEGDGARSVSAVGSELGHTQGQDTLRHEPRTGSDTHGQRLNHHLQQNNRNIGESTQANTESDLESGTNESQGPREQTGNGKEFVTDHYIHENAGPGTRYDEEDGPEHVMQYGSFQSSDTLFGGPRENEELHQEAKAVHEDEGNDKEERQESAEEGEIKREQDDEGRKVYEPLQLKYVTLDPNSPSEEYPTYKTVNKDSMESKGKKERDENENEKEEEEEEEDDGGGIYETLSKILEKKDAISRDEDIVGREDGEVKNKKQAESYNNYWVLEYSKPTFRK
jgi:hypothetical protein